MILKIFIRCIILVFLFIYLILIKRKNKDIFLTLDNQLNQKLERIYKIYENCSSKYPMECGSNYEGKHIAHPPSIYKSYLCKFPIKFSIISETTKKCFKSSLIISVVSSPDSFINRYSYRKSYSVYKNIYPLYFFIGLSRNKTINELIIDENKKYNDMIIFDYISSYYNNSIQFVMSMRWINKNCKSYRYILSQQSDTFVNIPFYQRYYEYLNVSYSVISFIRKKSGVFRNKKSMWYIPQSVYNETEIWPAFPVIAHVFLLKEIVKKIIHASHNFKTILFMDDVYLGMLLKYENITIKNNIIFPFIYHYNYMKIVNITKIKKRIFTLHEINPGGVYYLSSKIYSER